MMEPYSMVKTAVQVLAFRTDALLSDSSACIGGCRHDNTHDEDAYQGRPSDINQSTSGCVFDDMDASCTTASLSSLTLGVEPGTKSEHPGLEARDSFMLEVGMSSGDDCSVHSGNLGAPPYTFARRIDPYDIEFDCNDCDMQPLPVTGQHWREEEQEQRQHRRSSTNPVPFAGGGGGQLYRAWYGSRSSPRHRRERVAIKLVCANVFDPLAVSEFMREATFMTRLQHPHVVHREESWSFADALLCFCLLLRCAGWTTGTRRRVLFGCTMFVSCVAMF